MSDAGTIRFTDRAAARFDGTRRDAHGRACRYPAPDKLRRLTCEGGFAARHAETGEQTGPGAAADPSRILVLENIA